MEKWQFDLEQYSKQGEMDKKEKAYAWKTAIGLQDVDGLKPSEYLLETAKEHIEGNVELSEAKYRIDSYYEAQSSRLESEARVEEADKVSLRITEILGEKTFNFSPAELLSIHKRMFTGIYKHAGKIRDCNISKKEWVLNNESVIYASADSISATLDYDFSKEKEFSYEDMSVPEAVEHIAKFTSDIWQVHPFAEGNTRTIAVFIIKYLKAFGFSIDNDLFADNSWYFRNALARANYNNIPNGIHETMCYLEMFFQNLLLNEQHELKDRSLYKE